MRLRIITSTFLFAAGIVATGLLTPVTALADGPLVLNMDVGGNCVAGHKPTSEPITVKLLRSNGTTREKHTSHTSLLEWEVCFSVPVMGSKVRMTTKFAAERTVKIPVLTAKANRVTNVVSGQAPAGGGVTILYSECNPAYCLATTPRHATTNSHGRYQKDLGSGSASADIDGSDHLRVTYQNATGDTFDAVAYVPYVQIQQPNRVDANCLPLGSRTLKLFTSGGTLRAVRSFTEKLPCEGKRLTFRKAGKPVTIHVGDRITGDFAADAALTWPSMAVTGEGTVLSGHCLKNATYAVLLAHNDNYLDHVGATDSTGAFSVDLAGAWTFQAGDDLDLVCETPRGDRVRFRRTL